MKTRYYFDLPAIFFATIPAGRIFKGNNNAYEGVIGSESVDLMDNIHVELINS